MGFIILTDNNKQHLNLSKEAWLCIDDDINNFTNPRNKKNLSGFLNTVFNNFYREANASISIRITNYQDELNNILKQFEIGIESNILFTLKEKLIENETFKLKQNISQIKGEGRKFRINNDNLKILEDSHENLFYDNSLGLYLKAIFEEYTKKPYYLREQIYFKEHIDKINYSLKNNQMIKITLINNVKFWVSPFSLETEKTQTFNYLIGVAREFNKNQTPPKTISSFRLSKIKDIYISERKSNISNQLKNSISKQLNNSGPQFMSSTECLIKVKLTEKGKKKYSSQIYMRPTYTKIEDDIYYFYATETQIIYYFFKFGNDALIIEPIALKKYLEKFYYESYIAYKEIK